MSIIWKYLDKRSGTIEAIKDYASMRFIIGNTDEEIRKAYDQMANAGGSGSDGMPHVRNLHPVEDKALRCIEEVDLLKERYRQAMEYMEWFEPAWNELTDDERYVLETFYSGHDDVQGAVYEVSDHFQIERSTAYNRKNRALARLQVLLFGKS